MTHYCHLPQVSDLSKRLTFVLFLKLNLSKKTHYCHLPQVQTIQEAHFCSLPQAWSLSKKTHYCHLKVMNHTPIPNTILQQTIQPPHSQLVPSINKPITSPHSQPKGGWVGIQCLNQQETIKFTHARQFPWQPTWLHSQSHLTIWIHANQILQICFLISPFVAF